MRVPKRLRSHLSEDDLDLIANAISEAERETSGELRVHIVPRLLPFESARKRAIREFFRLGVDQTKDGSGVLLFLAVRSHRFEIVADQTINGKVGEEAWNEIALEITSHIRKNGIGDGLQHGVRRIGRFLSRHFPIQPDDVNELPDEVTFG
ncbi:MAG: TPM domain-containing protein [Acidobacteria bacterium]|nr:TPM domain-containing protein [Acidobacteriota bacterium]